MWMMPLHLHVNQKPNDDDHALQYSFSDTLMSDRCSDIILEKTKQIKCNVFKIFIDP